MLTPGDDPMHYGEPVIPPTVFVVDNDPVMCASLRALLASVGHRVATFGSGAKFLEAYDDATPGCLVLETRIPGMMGLELQKKLPENGIMLPLIFFTA